MWFTPDLGRKRKWYKSLPLTILSASFPCKKNSASGKTAKKWVETPLIPGYCFVNITRKEYDKVLQFNNVVSYITFERKAAIVSKSEIEALQTMLHQFDFEVNVTMEKFQTRKTG